jgi:hypothetical protein
MKYYATEMTIRTEVDVENPNLTNIQSRLGVGEPRVHGRGSQGRRDRRTVTRWLFANAQEGRRSVLIRRVVLDDFILVNSSCFSEPLPLGSLVPWHQHEYRLAWTESFPSTPGIQCGVRIAPYYDTA